MMGRGVIFIDWNCKSVAHRSYQRSCHLGRHASSTGEICGKRPLTLAGRLASPQRFPHRFAMQLA